MLISKEPKAYSNRIKILSQKRCIIGESPIWNEAENALYFTNGFGNEICKYNFTSQTMEAIPVEKSCAAFAFDKSNRLIVSRYDGVFYLNPDGSISNIYDPSELRIQYANDMKTGPDGRLYVGTQSSKRIGSSDAVDGKLYRIDSFGNVKILLDSLSLSNGMDWSDDGKFFYHTDSDTHIIKEYFFDIKSGCIEFSGRQINIKGVDGFTMDKNNNIYAACWGFGHIAVINTEKMQIEKYIKLPCATPASCAFAGRNSDILAITTASFNTDICKDQNAGFTILLTNEAIGRKPYLFG